jgi:hypothetical protein
MYIKAQTSNQSIFFNLQNQLLYIWCIHVFFFIDVFFFKLKNLNIVTKLENYCLYAMLIACKCMSLCKKLDCDVKSEPPYLATTLMSKP